jgi:Polysaccharide deacetylase
MLIVDVEHDWAGVGRVAVREVLPRFLELLDRCAASATFFVVAELVDEIRGVLPTESRHEIGSHSLSHVRLTNVSAQEQRNEVVVSKRMLEAAGYVVRGFRSPYAQHPHGLCSLLAEAGYRYDASLGPDLPFRRRGAPATLSYGDNGLPRLATGLLRDRVTPSALTWLRIYDPFGTYMLSQNTRSLSCHLHEFLEDSRGWEQLPAPLRALHRRNSGRPAWSIMERALTNGARYTTCADVLDECEAISA